MLLCDGLLIPCQILNDRYKFRELARGYEDTQGTRRAHDEDEKEGRASKRRRTLGRETIDQMDLEVMNAYPAPHQRDMES